MDIGDIQKIQAEGLALHQQGRLDEAEAHYLRVLRLAPRHADAHHLLGVIEKSRRHYNVAIQSISRAIAIAPDRAPYYNNMGVCYLDRDEKITAELCFLRALRLDEQYPDAWNNLGLARLGTEQYDNALAAFQRALKLDANNVRVLCNIGKLYFEIDRTTEALEWYERALACSPDWISARFGKTACLAKLGRHEEALSVVENLPALPPMRNAEALQKKGAILAALGRLDEAVAALDQSLEFNPGAVEVALARVHVRKVTREEPFFRHMEAFAKALPQTHGYGRAKLCYAIGKAYQDVGDIAEAAPYYAQGAEARRQQETWDEDADERTFSNYRRVLTREFIEGLRGEGDDSARPIFILGMPRSGTTLIEQIICSHPDVFAGGELVFIADSLSGYAVPGGNLPLRPAGEALAGVTALGPRAKWYLAQLEKLLGYAGQKRVTDKMPGNFTVLGLISAMFPNARIIHSRRDPIDTCLSCYTILFSTGHYWSYSLDTLGRRFRRYWALMEHWRRELPGRFLEVRYEDTVDDTEAVARRMLEWCGLDWDDRVLKFYETKRPVSTASVIQVRQPIYTSSKGRWKKWEPYIQPLLDGIGDLEEQYWAEQSR
jgi:tetratricopeptide (TPR) repeat protein